MLEMELIVGINSTQLSPQGAFAPQSKLLLVGYNFVIH
jgi:hypothetical protein